GAPTGYPSPPPPESATLTGRLMASFFSCRPRRTSSIQTDHPVASADARNLAPARRSTAFPAHPLAHTRAAGIGAPVRGSRTHGVADEHELAAAAVAARLRSRGVTHGRQVVLRARRG